MVASTQESIIVSIIIKENYLATLSFDEHKKCVQPPRFDSETRLILSFGILYMSYLMWVTNSGFIIEIYNYVMYKAKDKADANI